MESQTTAKPPNTPEEPRSEAGPAVTAEPPANQPETPRAAPQPPLASPYSASPYGPPSNAPYSPYAPSARPPMPPRSNTGWVIGGVVGALVLIGLALTLIIALVAGFAFHGTEGTTRTAVTTRTLTVSGSPYLVVRNAAGNLRITGGDTSLVVVRATKHVRSSDANSAQRALDNIGVTIAQNANTITVSSTFPSGLFSALNQSHGVDYDITLPPGSAIQADLSAGNIDVAGISGTLTLVSSAGNITTRNVAFGPGSSCRTSAGNVSANGRLAEGGSLQVRVAAGNATVELPADTATHLDADVSVGNLTITGFAISVSNTGFTSHHASGDTHANPHGEVSVTVSTGNVTIVAR